MTESYITPKRESNPFVRGYVCQHKHIANFIVIVNIEESRESYFSGTCINSVNGAPFKLGENEIFWKKDFKPYFGEVGLVSHGQPKPKELLMGDLYASKSDPSWIFIADTPTYDLLTGFTVVTCPDQSMVGSYWQMELRSVDHYTGSVTIKS